MLILKRFIQDDSGATAIEYALIAALMATALITAMGYVTDGLDSAFKKIGDSLKK